MDRTRAVALIAIAVGGLVGCTSHKQARVEAHQRWYETRASVLLSVGEDQFRVGDLDGAGNSAKEALALSPKMTSAHMLLARVAIEQGRYVQAQQILLAVAGQEPSNAQIPYLMGVVKERRREYGHALRFYDKARALSAHNAAYVLASAEVLAALDRADEGLALIEGKLPELDPTAGLHQVAGELAMLAGKPGKAAEHYTQARMLAPDNLDIQVSLAKADFFAGRYRAATIILDRLIAEEKDYADRPWMLTMLGDSHLALGHSREAKACFVRATELEPADARHWVKLAKAAVICQDLPRAVLSAGRALHLEPTDAQASVLLGYALLSQGLAAPANDVLASAVRAHPRDPMLRCLLGRSYAAMGDKQQAERCYQATLEIDPDDVIARHLLADRR